MDPFATTKQKADVWLNELAGDLGLESRDKALLALRGGLHALRDRLALDEAVQLGAQLPMLIRGLYYEGWSPRHTPVKVRTREEFLRLVERPFGNFDATLDPEEVARAVFDLLARSVSTGEIDDVRGSLPDAIEALWS
jgi:uncharacterized protein (DUF2267 family)